MTKNIAIFLLGFACLPAFATYQKGETIPNICWQALDQSSGRATEKTICLDDYKNTVRVLLFNAGWCGPCRQEFSELVPRVREFTGQRVTFISLSSAGSSPSQPPNLAWLTRWQQMYKIGFPFATAPNDYGRDFNPAGGIPNVAVIDKNDVLQHAEMGGNVGGLFEVVRSLVQ